MVQICALLSETPLLMVFMSPWMNFLNVLLLVSDLLAVLLKRFETEILNGKTANTAFLSRKDACG